MNSEYDVDFAADLRAAITRLVKKLRKESPSGQRLSQTERSTLGLLNQYNNLLPSELAEMEMITNQSMSQVLNHLFELGYITRTISESDKRKINISLSVEGENMLTQLRQERNEWLAKAILNVCTPEEQAQLKQVIGPILKIADFVESKK